MARWHEGEERGERRGEDDRRWRSEDPGWRGRDWRDEWERAHPGWRSVEDRWLGRDRMLTYGPEDYDGEYGRAIRGRHGGGEEEPRRPLGERMREELRRLTHRGPKGYKRSDERIQDEVSERIARSDINAEDVEVKVEKSEVTLVGFVDSRWDKRRLEDIADDVFGVDEVMNLLRVRREEHAHGAPATSLGQASQGTAGTGQPGQRTSMQQPGARH